MAGESGLELGADRVDEMLAIIKTLTRRQVLVGIPESTARMDVGASNAALGYVHEFGSPANNIPARPFLYDTLEQMQDKISALLERAASFYTAGKPADGENQLQALGMMAAAAVKNTITSGGIQPYERLSPRTLAARRGRGNLSEKPLIDTGQMIGSITYVIRDKK